MPPPNILHSSQSPCSCLAEALVLCDPLTSSLTHSLLSKCTPCSRKVELSHMASSVPTGCCWQPRQGSPSLMVGPKVLPYCNLCCTFPCPPPALDPLPGHAPHKYTVLTCIALRGQPSFWYLATSDPSRAHHVLPWPAKVPPPPLACVGPQPHSALILSS